MRCSFYRSSSPYRTCFMPASWKAISETGARRIIDRQAPLGRIGRVEIVMD